MDKPEAVVFDVGKPEAVLFDIDGTLVDVSSVRHYVEGRNTDYDAFHKASVFCPPNQWVVDEANWWSEVEVDVILVTARQKKYRPTTQDWLMKYDVSYNFMCMRPDGDQRRDYEVKKEILEYLQKSYTIIRAYDDNPSTYPLWLEYGIPVTVVPGWGSA